MRPTQRKGLLSPTTNSAGLLGAVSNRSDSVDDGGWVCGGLPCFGGRDRKLWRMMQEGEKGFNQSGLGVEIPYVGATAQVACTVYSGLNP